MPLDIKNYFLNKLKELSTGNISDDEKKMLSFGQMEEFIFKRISSKQFRKNKLSEETKKTLRSKISLSIKNNKPIYLIFAFGGYKNHWVEDIHPKVGWSEFFHLLYITKLLIPIAKEYKPGIYLEYESEAEAGVYHNNQSKGDVDAYTNSFKKLIEFIKPYLPENFQFNYITLPEQYDTEELFKRVGELIPQAAENLRKEFGENLGNEVKRSLFNLKLNGKEDFTNKTKDELEEIALKSLAFNHIFLDEDYKIREEYFNGEERIAMVGAYCSKEENPDNWVAINSCARSNNAFWTSIGVLFKTKDGYEEHILGPEAYMKIKDNVKKVEINLFEDGLNYLNQLPVLE